jgi:hypothetical protein
MFYAICTSKCQDFSIAKGTIYIPRKGWKNANNNEKIRAKYSNTNFVVIAEFSNKEAAAAYVASII